ncbi:MAG: S8 family serine peptidase, partial [Eggerthellaceae bacterium]|nr:S8 family serine peptidase [Eggerthellaceae bacterium]
MRLFKNKILISLIAFTLVWVSFPIISGQPQAFGEEGDQQQSVVSPADEGQDSGQSGEEASGQQDGEGQADLEGTNPSDGTDDGIDVDAAKLQTMSDLEDNPNLNYVDGQVIVVFNDAVSSDEASNILADVDSVDEGSVSDESMVADDTAVVDVSEGASVIDAVSELNDNPDVAFAQPNYIYQVMDDVSADGADPQAGVAPEATTINDPAYQVASTPPNDWQLSSINAYQAWSLTRANKTVSVAVIDTKVMANHEDLAANIDTAHAYDTTNGKGLTTDQGGHGTHVTGIIAAAANNGLGMAGVSYNANIIPICVGYDQYDPVAAKTVFMGTTSDLVAAYAYLFSDADGNGLTLAQETNLKVINISLGGSETDPSLEKSINDAYAAGVLTVCSAGNGSSNAPVYPGSFAKSVNVSALTYQAGNAPTFASNYSSFGSTIDLCAPGTAIYSTYYRSVSDYYKLQGTSM